MKPVTGWGAEIHRNSHSTEENSHTKRQRMTEAEETFRIELPQRQSPQGHQSPLEQGRLQMDIRYQNKKKSENTIEESLERAKLRLEKTEKFRKLSRNQ